MNLRNGQERREAGARDAVQAPRRIARDVESPLDQAAIFHASEHDVQSPVTHGSCGDEIETIQLAICRGEYFEDPALGSHFVILAARRSCSA